MPRRNRKDIEQAGDAFLLDLIPNTYISVVTAATAAKVDLNALDGTNPAGGAVVDFDLRGKRIWLQAVTLDVTILRGDHVATMTTATGLALETTDVVKNTTYYVDPDAANNELSFRSSGVGALRIYYSSDL